MKEEGESPRDPDTKKTGRQREESSEWRRLDPNRHTAGGDSPDPQLGTSRLGFKLTGPRRPGLARLKGRGFAGLQGLSEQEEAAPQTGLSLGGLSWVSGPSALAPPSLGQALPRCPSAPPSPESYLGLSQRAGLGVRAAQDVGLSFPRGLPAPAARGTQAAIRGCPVFFGGRTSPRKASLWKVCSSAKKKPPPPWWSPDAASEAPGVSGLMQGGQLKPPIL